MFKTMSPRIIGVWFLASAMIVAAAVVLGASITISTALLLATLCLLPPAIMLFVWRRTPLTVGELLHAVNTTRIPPRS
jgi:hypothetical protein